MITLFINNIPVSMHTQAPPQSDLTALLDHYQNRRFEYAYELAVSITEQYPNNQFAWKVLGALLRMTGNLSGALLANERVVSLDPSDPEALYNLSNTFKDLGRLDDAELGYRNSINLSPEFVEAHLNLGHTLQELGKLEDAEFSYINALTLRPDYAEAFNGLGNIKRELEQYHESIAHYKKAIAINPQYAEAHSNLGIALQKLKRFEDAEESYKKAISLKTIFAEAHYNLGTLLQELERFSEAEISYRNAIAIKQDYVSAYFNLGVILLEINDAASALEVVLHLLQIQLTIEAKSLFVESLKRVSPTHWDSTLSSMVTSALIEPWGRPPDLSGFSCQLLKLDASFQKSLYQSEISGYKDTSEFSIPEKNWPSFPLLNAILTSGPIADRELEHYFTNLRFRFLKNTVSLEQENSLGDEEFFYCALAHQCFINEYIYYQTPEEIEIAKSARDRLVNALIEKKDVATSLLLCVACYFPLSSIENCDALLGKTFSPDVMLVLKQQIREPLEELELRPHIPTLTGINNLTSLAVQSQYEENPYPRWIRLAAKFNRSYLNAFVSKKFPLADFSPLKDDRNLEVLIAGCGTGEHSIACSQLIRGASILAIDLSMASLAYAKRKTIEMGVASIEYAQADLLRLASIGKKFDIIESVGVLHHLDKPFEGWDALISVLRPNGLMRLGFYSELARKDIARVRNMINRDLIGSSLQDIRNYRHYLLGLNNPEDFKYAIHGTDFYSTSTCRDLIFHVQEHQMQLDMIAEFLEARQLKFLGFDLDKSTIYSYKIRFPDDPSATNLKNWHIYETENPHTFTSMYQFLVQKST